MDVATSNTSDGVHANDDGDGSVVGIGGAVANSSDVNAVTLCTKASIKLNRSFHQQNCPTSA